MLKPVFDFGRKVLGLTRDVEETKEAVVELRAAVTEMRAAVTDLYWRYSDLSHRLEMLSERFQGMARHEQDEREKLVLRLEVALSSLEKRLPRTP